MPLAADAILDAVRDVIEEGHGVARTISAESYCGGVYATLEVLPSATAALTAPRVEARITRTERDPASPPEPGAFALIQVDLEVHLVRAASLTTELIDDCRRELRALSSADGDVLRQALSFPGNLATTARGVDTTLVSGWLDYLGSNVGDLEIQGGQNGRLITTHTFRGTAKVAQETA